MKKLTILLLFTTLLNFAQQKIVTGKVTGADGPLPGATVKIVGINGGTSTGFDGEFRISAKEGDVLETFYIGSATKTKTVGTSNVIFFNLTNTANGFDGWIAKNKKMITDNPSAITILNEKFVSPQIKEVIDADDVSKIKFIKPKKATAKYGEIAKNGAINITTQNLNKLELEEFYQTYPFNFSNNSQNKTTEIKGSILNCESKPRKDAQITNLNTAKIVLADSLGKYKIKVFENDILLAEAPGAQQKRVKFTNQSVINISLKDLKSPFIEQVMTLKPIIYLYPSQKTEISLKINYNGKILTTFPKLENSWEVIAEPNGTIYDKITKRNYSSLFWDGTINFPASHYNYKTGFVVEKENLTTFLIEKLEFMGLNNTETNEFIQFWLPILEQNQTNFIHFLTGENYKQYSTNTVNPKPDTEIRIYMEFYNLTEKVNLPEQILPQTQRKGFSLVEWGGSDVTKAMKKSEF